VTPQGFCSGYVTILARFVAEDSDHVSQTIEAALTPLDKPPASLSFTPAGVRRQIR